eukprot:CAMPEP_0172519732 /NCGR_PEP_ID=MMETSP1066-20121228/291587_1 /TAXON_ID=671091 /ORGANISM="Coscinodiscus wailesii, Strain CCMP2513" /LENGTH=628 /DNA_ID=CAMNT_0013302367 /DNA_START=139 /DNA_END=2025 /DNA_ORIENTATION=-
MPEPPATTQNILPLTCSLTGLPTLNPVLTPSGHICDRNLLLTKLSENNDTDPFDQSASANGTTPRALHPDDLLPIKNIPPKPPASVGSFPILLQKMQSEVDGLLLELYDTRKVLEETRRELSTALYQNDAAVRVIARVSMERDAAKEQLARIVAEGGGVPAPAPRPMAPPPATAPEEEDGDDAGGKKRKRNDDAAAAAAPDSKKIPQEDVVTMVATWKTLSKGRRKRSVTSRSVSELEGLVEVDKKSWHKSNAPGTNCVAACGKWIVTGGRDKTAVVYNRESRTVAATLTGATQEIISVACRDDLDIVITASKDGSLRSYRDNKLVNTMNIDNTLLSAVLQPTGKYVITTAPTKIVFVSLATFQILATFERPDDGGGATFTCAGLHPDGLILAVGGSHGKVIIWDLKTQALSCTLEIPDNDKPVTSLAFSENGYHFASTHEDTCAVWDLRKLKLLVSIRDGDDDGGEAAASSPPLSCVSFDPSGKYLSYGSERGGVKIVVVKDWKKRVGNALLLEQAATGLVWDDEGIITVGMTDRFVRFWGDKVAEEKEEATFPQTQAEFDRYKDTISRSLKSFDVKQPYAQSVVTTVFFVSIRDGDEDGGEAASSSPPLSCASSDEQMIMPVVPTA